MQTIKDIMIQLEERVTTLIREFKSAERLLGNNGINKAISEDFDGIIDASSKQSLEKLVEVYLELVPVEKLVRNKCENLTDSLNKISQFINERENGTFFSFMMVAPTHKKRGRPAKGVFGE